ncbi:hypothetical protein DPV78_001583 [Talaromyces pinophilus]|nr:hypothetical protein DPV78_001583 [Talaromyces pinophilus]
MEDRDVYKTQRIINSLLFEHANWWIAERLAELMAGLMMDPKYSDLTLECDGETFNVHKAVVLTQSVVLEKACQGPWKEGVDNVIHIKEFDAPTVRRMVEFLYTGDYDQGKPEFVNPATDTDDEFPEAPAEDAEEVDNHNADLNPLFVQRPFNPETDIQTVEEGVFDISINAFRPPSPSEPEPESEAEEWEPEDETAANDFLEAFQPQLGVHAIADYYIINDLKKKAIEKVKVLLKKTMWSAEGFLAVAKEAFETTAPSPSEATSTFNEQEQEEETLRDIIITTASEHFPEITRAREFSRTDLNPEFAALLLQKAAGRFNSLRAELREQEQESMARWTIDTARMRAFMDIIGHLQAQKAELEDCIKRIQALSTCLICGRPYNVLIREEGGDQSNDGDDDDGYDAGNSVDDLSFPILAAREQTRSGKKYVLECKRCNLHGMRSGDLLGDDEPFDGDELFQGVAELFADELPAEPWVQGDNDQFAGALYGNDDDDL